MPSQPKHKQPPVATVRARLLKLAPEPIAPEWLITAALGAAGKPRLVNKALKALDAEAGAVKALRQSLERLQPEWPDHTLESGLL